ncbi:MAG: hypothetical protein V4819_00475 [Verrucomicrobiota bacterium]
MELDWKGSVILTKLSEGCTYSEAAAAASISRRGLLKRQHSSPEFAVAVLAAREAGKAERTFRLWLRHPFRGKRPPTGKGHGGKPRFRYGRR